MSNLTLLSTETIAIIGALQVYEFNLKNPCFSHEKKADLKLSHILYWSVRTWQKNILCLKAFKLTELKRNVNLSEFVRTKTTKKQFSLWTKLIELNYV